MDGLVVLSSNIRYNDRVVEGLVKVKVEVGQNLKSFHPFLQWINLRRLSG